MWGALVTDWRILYLYDPGIAKWYEEFFLKEDWKSYPKTLWNIYLSNIAFVSEFRMLFLFYSKLRVSCKCKEHGFREISLETHWEWLKGYT